MSDLFPQGSSVEEVKALWREIALRLHPDAGGTAEEFHAAHEAYQRALSDAESSSATSVCVTCGGKPYFIERGAHRLRTACPACGVSK